MKFSSEVCKKHLDASVSLFYWTQQPSFTPQWLTTKPPVTAHEAMCRLCGASAWPRKSSYPARDFSRGSPDTRGYFTGIPSTYSEAPAGYPWGFGITCGRYCTCKMYNPFNSNRGQRRRRRLPWVLDWGNHFSKKESVTYVDWCFLRRKCHVAVVPWIKKQTNQKWILKILGSKICARLFTQEKGLKWLLSKSHEEGKCKDWCAVFTIGS